MAEMNSMKLCQICLKESYLYSNMLTEQLGDGSHLVDVINDLLQLDMEYEECYSEFLCSDCYNKISEFRIFKRTAHEGRAFLLYSNGSVENIGTKLEVETADVEGFVPVQTEVYLVPVKIEEDDSVPDDKDPLELDLKAEAEEPWHLEEGASGNGDMKMSNMLVPLAESEDELEYDGVVTSQEQHRTQMNMLLMDDEGERNSSDEDFSHTPSVTKHKMLHAGEKTLQCVYCQKGFNYISELKRHERRHTGEKPFTCNICGKGFSRSDTLKVHETIHTGEKSLQCKLCKKEFRYASELNSHARVHTGEKPYNCNYCGKGFSRIHHLKQHERSHTGEKPFHCKLCKKGFSRSSILREHERVHTGEKPFKCKYCSKVFSFSSNMKAHESLHSYVPP